MNPLARAAVRAQSMGLKNYTIPELLPTWKSGVPQVSEFNTRHGIREGYKASSWVYVCVLRAMQYAASLPWVVYARKSVGADWEPQPGHPLEQLIEYPNPYMSRHDLIQRTTSHLLLGGNGLWTLIPGRIGTRGPEVPVEIWPIDPGPVSVVPSTAEFISKYLYRDGDVQKDLDPAWVVHTMLTDPNNPYWGMSPLQAAARVVDTDIEAVKWNQVSLANRAITDGIFAFDMPLTREQWDEARERVREQYSGHANARMPWVMGNKATYHQMSLTPVEMDWLEGRKLNREEIAAIFQTPLPLIVGQSDNTYANYEQARKAYWEDTILPFMESFIGALNRRLVPYFGKKDLLYIGIDTSGVAALRENVGQKIDNAVKMVDIGIPLNVAIQKVELDIDPVPGGDIGLVPAGKVPLEVVGGLDPLSNDPTATGGASLKDPVTWEPLPLPGGDKKVVQDTALNGPQLTALTNLVAQVAQEKIPPESAAGIIAVAFPMLTEEEIQKILTGVPGFAPANPPPVTPPAELGKPVVDPAKPPASTAAEPPAPPAP